MGSRRRGTQHRREAQGFRQMVLKRSPRTTGGQLAWGTTSLVGLTGRPVEGQTGLRGSLMELLTSGMVVVGLYSSFEKLRAVSNKYTRKGRKKTAQMKKIE